MTILKAIIDNYRSFCHEEILFKRRNLLVGENNVGKTNLLEAINLVLDPYALYQKNLISELDFFGRKTHNKDRSPVEIKIELVIGNLSEDDENYFRNKAGGWECWNIQEKKTIESAETTACFDDNNNMKVFRVAFSAKYDEIEDEFKWETFYPKSKEDESLNPSFTPSDKKRFGFFFLRSYRNVNQTFTFSTYSILNKLLKERNIKLSEQEAAMIEDAQQIGKRLQDNVDFENLLQEIIKELNRFVPLDAKSAQQLKFELLMLSRFGILRNLVPSVHVEGAEMPYPAAYQGGGTRNALVFSSIVKLAERTQNCIFLFEEPENSLHPHLQRNITRRVQSLSNQCFVSSHSPCIAEPFNLREILLLRKKNYSTKAVRPEWGEKGMKFIERYYKSQVVQALFSKAIVLVEGPTDEGFFSEFSQYLDGRGFTHLRGFDSLGCTIIPCESKTQIPTFAEHLRGLKLPLIALIDDEETTRSSTDSIKEMCGLTVSFPLDTNLEKVLLLQSSFEQIGSFIAQLHEIRGDVFRELYNGFRNSSNVQSSRHLSDLLNAIEKIYSSDKLECCKKLYNILVDNLSVKSTRYGKLWGSQYCKIREGIKFPKNIIEIFVYINKYLQGSLKNNEGNPKKYVQLTL